MPDYWDDKFDYLADTRAMYHNLDYWRFLVTSVWHLDRAPRRVVDFGCGYGWLAHWLMPLLARGSTYFGFDLSSPLLNQGARAAERLPAATRFVRADVLEAPFADASFDLAICHTVLMHLARPDRALAEMIRVTRAGGLVVCCETNRNAVNALLHIHETNEQEQTPLSMLQTMNAQIRRQSGVDYNLGIKMPVLMREAGLVDVQARISDAVGLVFPPFDTPEKQREFDTTCADGLGTVPRHAESVEQWRKFMTDRGASEADALAEIRRVQERDFPNRGRSWHTINPGLITIAFGTVPPGR